MKVKSNVSRTILWALFMVVQSSWTQSLEESIILKPKDGEIHGTLLFPKASEKTPLVLIIAGSGPTDRNGNSPIMTNNALKLLAEGLLEKGIASVRYDKRGVGESRINGIEEINLRFENYINDAECWVEFLAKDNRFSEIIVLGHSEGSLIGMIASQKEGASRFISLAGTGDPAGKLLRDQLKSQPPFILDPSLRIIEKLEKGETEENVPQVLHSLFRQSVQPYLISWFRYNPQTEIAKLNKPILIIQGTTDIQTSISDAEKLAESNQKSVTWIIDGMNHILKEAELDRNKNIQTYNQPDLPIKKELIDKIVGFINQQN